MRVHLVPVIHPNLQLNMVPIAARYHYRINRDIKSGEKVQHCHTIDLQLRKLFDRSKFLAADVFRLEDV